ncbi:unnamed protein product [Gordionus sp. m RMFG-2023]
MYINSQKNAKRKFKGGAEKLRKKNAAGLKAAGADPKQLKLSFFDKSIPKISTTASHSPLPETTTLSATSSCIMASAYIRENSTNNIIEIFTKENDW